jgi:hypothetical protein
VSKWRAKRRVGAERGCDSSGRVLHRCLPTRPGAGENGILGSAFDVSGDSGHSSEYAGIWVGGATGIDAVREFGAGDQSG